MDLLSLDAYIPSADFAEFHSRIVPASSSFVDDAIRSVTLGEMPFVKLLFVLRSVPDRLQGKRGLPTSDNFPLLQQMLDSGFTLLADKPRCEMVVGVIARVKGRRRPNKRLPGKEEFGSFDRPGFVKIAMNFQLIDLGSSTRLDTETRVVATDEASRRVFKAYWLLIRPWSGLIRRHWLRAIGYRATEKAKKTAR